MENLHNLQFDSEPWAILPSAAAEALAAVQGRQSRFAIASPSVSDRQGVAVIPIHGVIDQGATNQIAQHYLSVVENPDVKAIVFDVDSPGGTVTGVEELASLIYSTRGIKPTASQVSPLAASAAYWVAAQADEVISQPSGNVGSVGVFTMHADVSKALSDFGVKMTLISAGKYKVEGNPYQPLSEEAQAAVQERVDDIYGVFVDALARGRGVSASTVKEKFGQGRVLLAPNALKAGMIDGIGTLSQTVRRLSADRSVGMRAEQIKTKRDFESHLRDVGFSANMARALASHFQEDAKDLRDEAAADEVVERFARALNG